VQLRLNENVFPIHSFIHSFIHSWKGKTRYSKHADESGLWQSCVAFRHINLLLSSSVNHVRLLYRSFLSHFPGHATHQSWSFALRRETLTSNTASKFKASLASSYLALNMDHSRLYDSRCRVARSKEPSSVPHDSSNLSVREHGIHMLQAVWVQGLHRSNSSFGLCKMRPKSFPTSFITITQSRWVIQL
jgi:hypothetical protein